MELFAHEGGLIRIILKNYTTNKDCLRTIAEIEQTLAGLGARKILPVWRPHCIDERAGFDISDLRTGRVYTQEEAEAAPDTVIEARVRNSRRETVFFFSFKGFLHWWIMPDGWGGSSPIEPHVRQPF